MDTIFLTIQVVLALLLIAIVMMQKSTNEGLGLSTMNNNSVMSSNAATNFLSKLTVILITLFMINSLALSIIMDRKYNANTISKNIKQEQKAAEPETEAVEIKK